MPHAYLINLFLNAQVNEHFIPWMQCIIAYVYTLCCFICRRLYHRGKGRDWHAGREELTLS